MRRLDSGPGVTPVVSEPKQDAEDRVEVMRGLNPLLQSDLEGNDQQEYFLHSSEPGVITMQACGHTVFDKMSFWPRTYKMSRQ